MSDTKQTAVMYLIEQISRFGILTPTMSGQALAMEREQIEAAFVAGWNNADDGMCLIEDEQYYTDTYGNK